jgi:2-desacetyl-2-hydroxyethyl bacteriochlorophyllide A dehydrogenase
VVFIGPGEVAVEEVPLAPPGPGEVLVRTLFSGISGGTELLAYRGEVDPQLPLDEHLGALGGTFTFPFRYGYACVGEVEGELVFAFHPHQDRFVVPRSDLVRLGAVDPRVATLFPLVETALQITLDAGPVLDDDVVVLGLGAVGTLTAVLLARAGARVLGVDPLAWRRRAAAALGVEAVAPDDVPAGGAQLVVEATGRPDALAWGLDLLAHEGTALVASWYGTKPVTLPLGGAFHRRRLAIRSTQVSTIPARLAGRWSVQRRRSMAAALLGELPLGVLATHEFPLAGVAEAFAALDRREEGLGHVALCYE